MAPPDLPLELLLMIAHDIRDDYGELRYDDFNSFLQVNCALYASLNRTLWKEAAEDWVITRRIFTYLIHTNNLARLKFFLELGADAEIRLPFEITDPEDDGPLGVEEPTALIVAADSDDIPLARLLLKKGAKVQYFRRDGASKYSPIHAARSAEMVQLLLDHRADPNLGDDWGRPPLCWCAIRDDLAAMRAILLHGADANPDILRRPLHDAAERNITAVELLVEHGADVKEPDRHSRTPLHLAVMMGKIDVVKFLLERWPEGIRERDDDGETPLHLAARMGETDAVNILVQRWPDGMRERDNSLHTPLQLAAPWGKIEVVKILVEGWPEGMRATNKDQKTPLHLALESLDKENIDVVRLLVEQGPEGTRVRDNHLNTPLHLAASRWRIDEAGLLLEGWPEAIREKNQSGNMPLHVAAITGDAKMVRLLVERWPEGKEALSNDGKTPLSRFEEECRVLEYLCDEDKEEILDLLGAPCSEARRH
jgi:ankyrin repeat protein